MRGEHPEQSWDDWRTEGSSPHARGTPTRRWMLVFPSGIIPACAGNTMSSMVSPSAYGDHPRMRGEHVSEARERNRVMGSSPHARGTLALPVGVRPTAGIIPACAGNTLRKLCQFNLGRDHPRERGEQNACRSRSRSFEGSSPHARGTHRSCFNPCSIVGIIPACAGNTRLALGYVAGTGDHPRMRGEHPSFRKENSTRKGSSPHARGTRRLRLHEIVMRGIIPACAGSSPHARGTRFAR